MNEAEERFERTGDPEALDAAAAAFEHMFNRPTFKTMPVRFQLVVLNDAGIIYFRCYEVKGRLVDLDQAIALFQQVISRTPPGSREQRLLLVNLGNCLRERYASSGALDDFEAAIVADQEAVAHTPPGSPERHLLLGNLGSSLRDRYARTGAQDDLEAAIVAVQEAVDHAPPDSPERPGHLSNLGNCLRDRYARTGAQDDLEAAIVAVQEAVTRTPPDSPERPGRLSNLGAGLRDRYARTGAPDDLEATQSAYGQACEQGLVMDVAAALTAAWLWGDWALQRRAWEEATKAYNYGAQAVERLLAVQILRAGKETWLRDAQGLSACAAYALAQADQLEKAVETLEAGRARLLAEALERHRRDLEQLPASGHGELLKCYRQALTRWEHVVYLAEHPEATELTGSALRSTLETAHSELDGVIDAIRHVPGYGSFLQAPTFAEIRAAAQQTPLAYLLVTPVGGLALIVSPASEAKDPEQHRGVRPVWLNELTDSAVYEKMRGRGNTAQLGSYLGAYARWRIEPRNMEAREQWFQILEDTTHWLWEVLMGPLLAALAQPADAITSREGTVPAAVLIPAGLLGVLPLHAAWTEDNHAVPTGRRYALDTVALRYAPNARALSIAQELAREVAAEHMLLFVEPEPVSAHRLPAAEKEAQAILHYWPQATRTTRWHAAATQEELTLLLPTHEVFHFNGHASAGWNKPYQGGLLLAFNRRFSIREWQNLRLKMRLAVLSACETGVPGTVLPDEVIGLPTALAEAGVAGIVASLWSVADDSTAWLMAQFYRLWQQEGLPPPEALRHAQMDLRDYGYAHPFYWGAFTYTGV